MCWCFLFPFTSMRCKRSWNPRPSALHQANTSLACRSLLVARPKILGLTNYWVPYLTLVLVSLARPNPGFQKDTIRYAIFTCAQKLTNSQFNLPHGTKQKSNEETKNKNRDAQKKRSGHEGLVSMFPSGSRGKALVEGLGKELGCKSQGTRGKSPKMWSARANQRIINQLCWVKYLLNQAVYENR